jgi:hypothetical protein
VPSAPRSVALTAAEGRAGRSGLIESCLVVGVSIP